MWQFSSSVPLCRREGELCVLAGGSKAVVSQFALLTWVFLLDEEEVGKMEPRNSYSEDVKCLILQILAADAVSRDWEAHGSVSIH